MILVDFDRTLFRADDFYEYIRNTLSIKVTSAQWQAAYSKYQHQHAIMNIFSMIEQEFDVSRTELDAIKQSAKMVAPNYLYDNTHRLLTLLESSGKQIHIFTYGDASFQRYKINSSGLEGWSAIITDKPKHRHTVLNSASICIDDSPIELDMISEAHRRMSLIRVSHVGAKYSLVPHKDKTIKVAETLGELIDRLQTTGMLVSGK